MSKIVPFYAADQDLVDLLCSIITILHTERYPEEAMSERELNLFKKIVED